MNLLLQKYRIIGKKGEGTFSEVLKCQNIKDGTYVACKKMKQSYDNAEQINNLREIQAMRKLNPHPNVLELLEVIYDKKSGTLVLVCELMDMNIYELIRGKRHYLPATRVRHYMYQLLKSVDHMHRHGIFHRDVKPENILIKEDLLKLADFGSCRSIFSKQPYTEYISTRWYRAPECLLTDGYYSYKMDMWSVGCVFFEILSLHPLFPGSNEVDQIAKIHDVMGTPDTEVLNKLKRSKGMNFNFPPKKGTGIERMLPHASSDAVDLIYQMCAYDPDVRLSAKQGLRHPYFKELREADKRAMAKVRQEKKALEKIELRPPESGEEETRLKLVELPPDASPTTMNGSPELAMYPTIKAQSLPVPNQPFKERKRVGVPKYRGVPRAEAYASDSGSNTSVRSNASFSTNASSKTNKTHRRKKRKNHRRSTEGTGGQSHTGLLPRVSMPPASYNPSFGGTSFSTSFSKFYGPPGSTLLPSLGATYKPHKAAAKPKGMYGAYSLPSLDRRY